MSCLFEIIYSKKLFKQHMLVHTKRKDFQCDACKKKFSQNSNLKAHMLTHTKVEAHECDICKKKFSINSSLVKHFRIHLGEKPYGCAECGKWFTTSSGRCSYIRNHHKELIKNQQSKLKCKIPRTIVYDYLKSIYEYNSSYL